MGKKSHGLPTIAEDAPEAVSVAEQVPPEVVEQEPQKIEVHSSEVVIGVPVMVGVNGYARRRIDVKLNGKQAATLKSIQLGLEAKEAKLADGRFVSRPMHVVQWLLENAIG